MSDTAGIMIGQAHPWATQWNKNVQDPFAARVKALFDPITEARKAGTLTHQQAKDALEQFNFEVSDLRQAQSEFEALGAGQRQVIAGSRKTLDPLISQWGADLQAHLDSLGAPPPEPTIAPESAPTPTSILAGEGTTPLRKAMGAAEQQRKRAMGGGRQTTILAGNVPLGNTGRRRTLLGY
jgi:hypothetical protein